MARILIIDDDKDFAIDAAAVLRREGFETDVALSYMDASSKLKDADVKFDVISLDIMMPVDDIEDEKLKERAKDGYNTGLLIYDVFLKDRPETKVVVCTVVGELASARLRPGTTVLQKPVGVDDYVAAIKKASINPI